MSIAVYTAIAQGFDNLRPPLVIEPNVRYICFTDSPLLPDCAPWEFRPLVDIGHPARMSRVPKILPHLMLPESFDYSIWHDANFQLSMKPSEIVGTLLRNHDWAAHVHPARDCVYKEAEILLSEKIGTPGLVRAEIARYRLEGHPPCFGLYANGFIARRHTVAVEKVCELWWRLYAAGCERDQLSLPVAMRHLDFKIERILNDIYQSPYMHYNWHAAWRDKGDNAAFWPSRKRVSERAAALALALQKPIPWSDK